MGGRGYTKGYWYIYRSAESTGHRLVEFGAVGHWLVE